MKTSLLILLTVVSSVFATETVVDLPPDPATITIQTASGDKSTENIRDVWANYPQLRDKIKAEQAKKLVADDEIAAHKRFAYLSAGKIDIPKDAADKHKARIDKFAKAKEDALNSVIKKAAVSVKIDSTMPQDIVDGSIKNLNDARALAVKAKARKDELVAAGIPISKTTSDAVEAVQPRPTPAPAPPSPTPNDGL